MAGGLMAWMLWALWAGCGQVVGSEKPDGLLSLASLPIKPTNIEKIFIYLEMYRKSGEIVVGRAGAEVVGRAVLEADQRWRSDLVRVDTEQAFKNDPSRGQKQPDRAMRGDHA